MGAERLGELEAHVAEPADPDDAHLAQDPYFREAIFETVEIYESKWMVPEREPGFLAAEAKRARAAEG